MRPPRPTLTSHPPPPHLPTLAEEFPTALSPFTVAGYRFILLIECKHHEVRDFVYFVHLCNPST